METLDNDDLIALLKVKNSKFEFENNPLGFSFPCCICKHAEEDQHSDCCSNCGHIN